MTNPRDEGTAPGVQPPLSTNESADRPAVPFGLQPDAFFDATASGSQAAADQFERVRAWGGERPRVSLGAAALLAVGAGVCSAIYVRRRTQARVQRLELLAMRAGAMRAMLPSTLPSARQAAPFGGAGGALLMAALLVARARRTQSTSRVDQLHHRLAELEAQASSLSIDRPRPRDLALGVGVGLGIAGLVSRVAPRQSSSS